MRNGVSNPIDSRYKTNFNRSFNTNKSPDTTQDILTINARNTSLILKEGDKVGFKI